MAIALLSLLLHLAAIVSIGGWIARTVPAGPLEYKGALVARLELRGAPTAAPAAGKPQPSRAAVAAPRRARTAPAATAPAPPAAIASPPTPPAPAASPDPLAGASLAQLDGASQRQPDYLRVNPPPSAEFSYDMTITSAAGDQIGAGSSTLSWRLQNGRYALRINSQYGAGGARDHARAFSSDGALDDMGIAPERAQEQRDHEDALDTRFDREAGVMRHAGSLRTDPVFNGSQDQASVLMQLAGIGAAARALRSGDEFVLHVSRAADAGVLVLTVQGQVQLDSPLGALETWHLAQAGGSGLEVWLAPAYHWMPVQIRTTGPDGVAVTELVRAIAAPKPAPG
jgi:hypothetical protein